MIEDMHKLVQNAVSRCNLANVSEKLKVRKVMPFKKLMKKVEPDPNAMLAVRKK